MAGKINVRIGQLSKPLKTFTVKEGTTLIGFLELRKMKYGSSVRVNGNVAKKTATLKTGDIITATEAISGGK